jgi:hypothetical protein
MDLATLLHGLPSAAVYAIAMATAGVLAGLACLLLAPLARVPQGKEHLDIAMRTTGAVMAALTLILAFCAVQARSQAADAQRLVATEVSAIGTMARIADRLGAPGHAMRRDLAAYAASIAAQEFPAMATQGRHPATQALLEALEAASYQAAAAAPEVLATDMLQEFDDMDSARDRRLEGARIGLPAEFWMLILVLFFLLALTGALYPPRLHTIGMLAVQAAGVGALIAFVFLMDQPFRGSIGVSAAPYEALSQGLAHRAAAIPGATRHARP